MHYQRWVRHGDPELRYKRKYFFNEKYFDSISTPEQAYWLGFITADGCVSDDPNYTVLEIALQKRDADHLLKFADCIESTSPLQVSRDNMRIRAHSKHMVESLKHLGVTPRKSLIVKPWSGIPNLMPAYWRGLFDGDGCISRRKEDPGRKNRRWSISIVGSYDCVDGFREWAQEICGSIASIHKATKISERWSWAVAGTEKPQILARELKIAYPSGLSRKQDLLEEFSKVVYLGGCFCDYANATWTRPLYQSNDTNAGSYWN